MKTDIVFDIETTGLEPIQDRVTAIAIKSSNFEIVLSDNDERAMLQEFWQFMKQFEYFRLIGFNNTMFDIPFIIVRSFKHDIRVIDVRGKLIDLRFILSFGGKFKNGKLDDYSRLIGAGDKYNGWNAGFVASLWNECKLDELKQYALQDVRLTYQIYERCKKIGLI